MSGGAQSAVPRIGVLVWLFVSIVPAFAATGFFTRHYREHERELAAEWATRAESARRVRDVAAEVDALQNALRFSPATLDYRFRLARALIDGKRLTEARAHLLSLWEIEPGSGPVNLELGRLTVLNRGDRRDAIRYYHNAIEGAWSDAPEEHRREARIELARFLIDRADATQAQAELLPLVDDLPSAPSQVAAIGWLLFEAGAASRARQVFEVGLRGAPAERTLLLGAGRTAFAAHDYAAATTYFSRARHAGVVDPALDRELAIASEVLSLNPYAPRLTRAERARRATEAFEIASDRLTRCLSECRDAPDALKALESERSLLKPRVAQRRIRANPELLDRVMEFVFRTEHQTQASGATAAPADMALLILERHQPGN